MEETKSSSSLTPYQSQYINTPLPIPNEMDIDIGNPLPPVVENPPPPSLAKKRVYKKRTAQPIEQPGLEQSPEVLQVPAKKRTYKKRTVAVEQPTVQPAVPEISQAPVKKRTYKKRTVQPIIEQPPTIIPEPVIESVQVPTQEPEPVPELIPEPEPTQHNTMNVFLREKEKYERQHLLADHDYLYPDLNDPNFNVKLALKKEFYDARYDGRILNIEEQAEIMCNAKFELSPHQVFVKNFMSVQTPYKSMLLYHGLGTGKTCSAIGVAEEMRKYLKQTGIKKQIIVVASPNVQGNFRQQLFNEKKLVQITNIADPNEFTWNIESCVGNSLLDEINPNSIRNLTREKLISNINSLINEHYLFMGYIQFANTCKLWLGRNKRENETSAETDKREEENMRYYFDSRLVIIDEVHNIRMSDNTRKEMQQVAAILMHVVKYAQSLRLLLLSATPMFNSYTEIIWLTNLLNANDKRSQIQLSDVFTPDGEFKPAKRNADGTMTESGDDLLRRKLIGYVSYVRGENPYTFPYRVYPNVFSPENSITNISSYPSEQLNGVQIDESIQKLQVYVNMADADSYQMRVYSALLNYMREKDDELMNFEELQSFGYIVLQRPLEALNIVYPSSQMEAVLAQRTPYYSDGLFESVMSSGGLNETMNFKTIAEDSNDPFKHDYEYKPEILEKYGRIFSAEHLSKYSVKMSEICNQIRNSEGIVLIYSQYIDGGVIPMALALEEMGFSRYSSAMRQQQSLFKRRPAQPIDAITMMRKGEYPADKEFRPAQYIMITGDKGISPSNTEDVKYATTNNTDGSKVKVIIISKAGSEGLDFKAIRQIHILEPWFNINRIEQIIGRGVRNLSHCALPFAKRNVQIYLHGTIIRGSERETADLYLYRLAEQKGTKIGKVTRLLKENATDCILNIAQTNFTAEKLNENVANQNIQIELSTKNADGTPNKKDFEIGDLDGSELCDYMSCEFQCKPDLKLDERMETDIRTYTTANMSSNVNYIVNRIKMLYRERHEYTLSEIEKMVNAVRMYPIEQILYGLSLFSNNKNFYLYDKYGRFGYLANRGKYYAFQPIEISDERISYYERSVPVEYKKDRIILDVPSEFRDVTEQGTIAATTQRSHRQPEPADIGESYAPIVADIETSIRDMWAEQNAKSAESNWYKNASRILEHLHIVHNMSDEKIRQYAVEHYLDMANYTTKRTAFEGTYGRKTFDIQPEIESYIASYFRRGLLVSNDGKKQAMVLADKHDLKILILSGTVWTEGSSQDISAFSKEFISKYSVPDRKNLNTIIGYMAQFKQEDMAFYYKDIYANRNKTGRRCDRSGGKAPIISMLNTLTNNMYNDENAKKLFPGNLCVIMELILRQRQETSRDKIYFLTPEQTIFSGITNWSAKPLNGIETNIEQTEEAEEVVQPLAKEPKGQPMAKEPKGQPMAKEPKGQPMAKEPKGQPMAKEPKGQPLAKAKPCPEGKEINPVTGRCVAVCKPGLVRDPTTGKCVKP